MSNEFYGKRNTKRFLRLHLPEIVNVISVTVTSFILTGWRGVIGSDVASHLPPVLRIISVGELDQDWYAVSTADTKVHFFYAQLFRIFLLNKDLGTSVFLALFFGALLLRVILLNSIIKHFGGRAWWLWLVLAISYASRYHLYGFIIPIDAGLTPRTISWTLALAALRYLVKKDYKKFAFFTGFGCLFQPSDGFINAAVLMAALFLSTGDELSISRRIRLTFYVVVSGAWFSLYVAIIMSKSKNMLLEDQYLAWAYVFFRAPYLRISPLEISLGVISLSVIILVGYKMRIEKILLHTAITSSVLVLLFCFGVNSLNIWLIQMYGIRSLGFLFLSLTLILCLITQKLFKERKIDFKRINFHAGKTLPLGVILITLILNSPISLIKNITDIDFRKASKLALQYPCNLEASRCASKNLDINTGEDSIQHVFLNNFVSFKQVGVGARNLEEWIIRIDKLTRSELRNEFLRQQSFGVYQTYILPKSQQSQFRS